MKMKLVQIDASTTEGLLRAEHLYTNGWRIIATNLFFLTFQKPTERKTKLEAATYKKKALKIIRKPGKLFDGLRKLVDFS